MSWVKSGARRTGNQSATTRMTLTKTMASPAPTSTRAAMPVSNEVASPKTSWPTVMSASPMRMSRREPKRSSSTPTGTCIAA